MLSQSGVLAAGAGAAAAGAAGAAGAGVTGGTATATLTGGDTLEIFDILSGTAYEVYEDIPADSATAEGALSCDGAQAAAVDPAVAADGLAQALRIDHGVVAATGVGRYEV